MAMFVHLAPESAAARIRRSGISRLRKAAGGVPGGAFAVPVTRNFFLSHQWLRELKRRGAGPIVGVYFRLGDDEPMVLSEADEEQARELDYEEMRPGSPQARPIDQEAT